MSFIFSSFFHLQFLLPLHLYSMQLVILRPVAPVEDSGVGLPSPGALENLAGMSRTLSSLAVTGESNPAAIPNNSGSSSGGIGAGSTSMGWDLSRMPEMADANSASVGGYQDSLMLVMSWMPSSSSRIVFDCLPGGSGTWTLPPAPPVSHARDG